MFLLLHGLTGVSGAVPAGIPEAGAAGKALRALQGLQPPGLAGPDRQSAC